MSNPDRRHPSLDLFERILANPDHDPADPMFGMTSTILSELSDAELAEFHRNITDVDKPKERCQNMPWFRVVEPLFEPNHGIHDATREAIEAVVGKRLR